MGLNQTQLQIFAENRDKDFWYGPYEELALFNFWKSIKDKSEGLMFTRRLEQYTLITCNFTSADPTEPVLSFSGDAIVINDEVNTENVPPNCDSVQLPLNGHTTNTANEDDPFVDVLIWPKVNDAAGKGPRKKVEHIPSVATSSKWLEWHNKKENDKKEKENAKLARMEKRRLLKEQKLLMQKEKNKKKSNRKTDSQVTLRN
ncbi:uncharacterized protein LOC134225781 [Armigeres subalbatus]|uniref:uncharacterized protein LOC134225781 n=1 Tax=Armigeres subalbatus TaxID=124917 RepID=UPI002ED328C6